MQHAVHTLVFAAATIPLMMSILLTKRLPPYYRLSRRGRMSVSPHPTSPCLAMSTSSPFVYEEIDGVERIEHYSPGGYHPICVGDRLHKRYRVMHKLGTGSFSTVWLARDEQLSKNVAVKVGISEPDQTEVNTLLQLTDPAAPQQEDFGRSLILPLLDHFNIHGPNGVHSCLVTALARCSLSATGASDFGLFQLQVARSLAGQLALAVAFIHSVGYVHGGESIPSICSSPALTFD